MSVSELKEQSLVSPSSSSLDMHLTELEEECARFLSLVAALRLMAGRPGAEDEDLRDSIEGDLYASISHMHNHVEPALKEMDRLLDEMPEDQDDSRPD